MISLAKPKKDWRRFGGNRWEENQKAKFRLWALGFLSPRQLNCYGNGKIQQKYRIPPYQRAASAWRLADLQERLNKAGLVAAGANQ